MIHACNVNTAFDVPILPSSRQIRLKTVTGSLIQHLGCKKIGMWLGNDDEYVECDITFEVTDVTSPVLSLGLILSRGAQLVMSGSSGHLIYMGKKASLINKDGVLYMRATRSSVQRTSDAALKASSTWLKAGVVAPVRARPSSSSSAAAPLPPEPYSLAEYDDEDAAFREALQYVPEEDDENLEVAEPAAVAAGEEVTDLAVREQAHEGGVLVPASLGAPKVPTKEEWDAHVLTQHASYRPWCEHCVQTRGREGSHARLNDGVELQSGVIACDYCHFSDDPASEKHDEEVKDKMATALVAHDTDTGCVFACQVTKKSSADTCALSALKNWIVSLGVTQCCLQSDGDAGIQTLMRATARQLVQAGINATTRKTVARDPQSNGAAESVVGTTKRMVRTLVSVVNTNYETRVSPRHWIFPWLIRHAAWSMSRFTPKGTGPNRNSAYYAVHGQNYRGSMIPFAETVHCKVVKRKGSGHKHSSEWRKGVFVGKQEGSDAWLIATNSGVETVRTIRRMPEDAAYDRSVYLAAGGVPWDSYRAASARTSAWHFATTDSCERRGGRC
jgi:hypothetical protein